MHRFFLDPSKTRDTTMILEGAEAHHALHVLRLRPGERVTVLDGVGGRTLAQVTRMDRATVSLCVLEQHQCARPTFGVTLFQATTKPKSMDLIIQKGTELGLGRLVPVITDRVVVRLDSSDAAKRLGKWRQLAIEALKQSGNVWLPTIAPVTRFEEAVRELDQSDLSLVGVIDPGADSVRQVMGRFTAKHGRAPSKAALWVGPEGDFSSAELATLHDRGVRAISFGHPVLRSETAAIAGVAILNEELRASHSSGMG